MLRRWCKVEKTIELTYEHIQSAVKHRPIISNCFDFYGFIDPFYIYKFCVLVCFHSHAFDAHAWIRLIDFRINDWNIQICMKNWISPFIIIVAVTQTITIKSFFPISIGHFWLIWFDFLFVSFPLSSSVCLWLRSSLWFRGALFSSVH